jgi:hypothetical protein
MYLERSETIIMNEFPDFEINGSDPVSTEFISRNIGRFHHACDAVCSLPYGRNSDKNNLTGIFKENRGTCSSKHAILKSLADAHGFTEIRLIAGIFRMSGRTTPKVAATLEKYKLNYIPEAHCYLKFNDRIYDFTRPGSRPEDFAGELVEETELKPGQISEFKVSYHKQFLATWAMNINLSYSTEEIWAIREECIKALSV